MVLVYFNIRKQVKMCQMKRHIDSKEVKEEEKDKSMKTQEL